MGDRDKLYERKCDYCSDGVGRHGSVGEYAASKVHIELNFDVLSVLMAFDGDAAI